jgi:hypothetical protein
MGRVKKQIFSRKSTQHSLPKFNLSGEDFGETPTPTTPVNKDIDNQNVTRLGRFGDDDNVLRDFLSDENEDRVNDTILKDKEVIFNRRRKTDIEKEDNDKDTRKKISRLFKLLLYYFLITIYIILIF